MSTVLVRLMVEMVKEQRARFTWRSGMGLVVLREDA
jgi:hypothetical protein